MTPSSHFDRACTHYDEGKALLKKGRTQQAYARFLRSAESLLNRGPLPDEQRRLLERIDDKLRRSSPTPDGGSEYKALWPAVFRSGLRRGPTVEAYLGQLVRSDRRYDEETLWASLEYLETGDGAGNRGLEVEVGRWLSAVLHIRLDTPIADATAYAPWLLRVLSVHPDWTFPRLYLGRFHYRCGRYVDAQKLLLGITGRMAQSAKVLNVLGRCFEKEGRVRSALEAYGKSLEKDPLQPHVHFRVGRLLLGRYRAALGLSSTFVMDTPP